MIERLMAAGTAFVLTLPCTAQEENTAGKGSKQDPKQDPKQSEQTKKVTPVVVTARKWGELNFDVPQSVGVITKEQIRDAGLDNVKSAARYVPNVLVPEFSARRLSFPFIRGIGSGQGDPAVTTFIDGVPQLQLSSTNLTFLDVERVEFLRGPSSALYGRNTMGGAINVVTKTPSNRFEYGGSTMFGNYDLQDYRASFSAPLVEDELFLSFSGLNSKRDGYTKNLFNGSDVDSRLSWFGRTQLLWIPNEIHEVRLIVYGENTNDGGFALSDVDGLKARPHRINQDFQGQTDRELVATTLSWTIHADGADFTSISGYQYWKILETTDFDFSPIDGVRRRTSAHQNYFSQEFRVASPEGGDVELGEDVKVKWLAGVSGFVSDSEDSATNEFRPGGAGILFPPMQVGVDRASGDFDSYSLSAFAQLTFTIDDRWDLTAAMRYDYESKDADIDRTFTTSGFTLPVSSTSPSENFDKFMPRASIAYRWSDQYMVYGLIARGYKAGGFNLTAPAGSETFRPEDNWNYEVGARARLFDDQLSARLAWFYIDWDDMQLSQFDVQSGGYVVNAGGSESTGVELELLGKPVEEVELFGSLGALSTEFGAFSDQFGQNVNGEHLPFAPNWTANVGTQVSIDVNENLQLFGRAEYFYVGTFYYDAGNNGGDNYQLTNFRVGAGGKNWRLDGWLNNAFDEEYIPIAFQPNPANPFQFVGESGAPRTYGFTVSVTF